MFNLVSLIPWRSFLQITFTFSYFFWLSAVASKACRSILTSCLRCTHHFSLQNHCTTLDCKHLEGTLALTNTKVCASRLPKMWTRVWLNVGCKEPSASTLLLFYSCHSITYKPRGIISGSKKSCSIDRSKSYHDDFSVDEVWLREPHSSGVRAYVRALFPSNDWRFSRHVLKVSRKVKTGFYSEWNGTRSKLV